MSSFSKNIIPRRAHRERSQPGRRVSRHGLLEKKKDYKARAKNANRKAYRLKLLREKAAFRNPDEFYHAMDSSAPTRGGRTVRQADKNMITSHFSSKGDARRLAETQDRAYVNLKRSQERSKIRSMRNNLHFIDAGASESIAQRTWYMDDEEFHNTANSSSRDRTESTHVSDRMSTAAEALHAREPRDEPTKRTNLLSERQRKSYDELSQRLTRVQRLGEAASDLALEQALLGKGARRKLRSADAEAGKPPVFKWRKERKK